MLELNSKDNKSYFNIACCYSLLENKEGYNAIAKAVEYGYTNIERIKTYNALEWLRKQPEYEQFVQNGFKVIAEISPESIPSKATPTNTSTPIFTDAMISQIEKLGKLKEQGLITDEEFQEQKKKLLA